MTWFVVALFCCALVGELGWLAHRAHRLNERVEGLRVHIDEIDQSVLLVREDLEELQVRVNAVEDKTDGGGAP